MEDVQIYALGNMTNSSSAMFERRRRILEEARKMIGEGGIEGFSIRELSKRAKVASRTLYNAFGSKDAIIANAIRSYFESFERKTSFSSDHGSFEGAFEHIVATTLRNCEVPNYVRAVAAIYFSPSLSANIREVLLVIGGYAWRPWLEALSVRRQMQQEVAFDDVLIDLSNIAFAKVHEWGLGTLTDEEFMNKSVEAQLLHLTGALRGAARIEVLDTYLRWRREPEFRGALLRDAAFRIEALERMD